MKLYNCHQDIELLAAETLPIDWLIYRQNCVTCQIVTEPQTVASRRGKMNCGVHIRMVAATAFIKLHLYVNVPIPSSFLSRERVY